ncbi:MAG: hypothetical protein Q8M09_02885 [Pseudomonadota bacterium]|nr:hypothetical protein [Pseudomonadota bacterium]MDP1573025.1 hypothetical protein [Pseudomonadota bacterium]MDP1903183.1 hypothetical protein [Pseudomonadota bacterium]
MKKGEVTFPSAFAQITSEREKSEVIGHLPQIAPKKHDRGTSRVAPASSRRLYSKNAGWKPALHVCGIHFESVGCNVFLMSHKKSPPAKPAGQIAWGIERRPAT